MNTEIELLITYYAQGYMSGWVSSFTYAHGARRTAFPIRDVGNICLSLAER